MRVIYLHQYFNTPDMPGGTRSYEMARRLVAAGHEVHMVTTWREPTPHRDWFVTTEAGITVHWLPLRYSNHMGFARRLVAFLRFAWASSRKAASLPGDVVFATSTPLTIALPGIYASRRKKRPMVFEVRDLWPDGLIAIGALRNPLAIALARMMEGAAYRSAAAIVALAPGMKEAVCARGVPPSAVHVIPNGCDFDVFDRAATEPVALPGPANGPAIVYVGTMGLVNGIAYIPRLAAEIRRVDPASTVRFCLVGDGSHRKAAEALAKELDVLDRTVFFAGPVTKREVARWVIAADATIITYDGSDMVYKDSVSNKFFDSIAAGRPVLANFSGYSTKAAADAGAGFILDRDPRVAAVQLLDVVRDRDSLRKAGEAAFRLAHEFSRDRLASRLEDVLRGVAAGASSGRRRVAGECA